jgi:hypothetical protein
MEGGRSLMLAPKRALVIAGVCLLLVLGTAPISANQRGTGTGMTADLDGVPIKLADVGKWYCHDFDYPAIHCFSRPQDMQQAPGFAAAATSTTYVTVYEFTTYQGAFMHMSQDYSILGLIGWNDRISSLVIHTSPGAVFWTDWLYTGTRYAVCCFTQLGSLGSFDNSFSSVFQN